MVAEVGFEPTTFGL